MASKKIKLNNGTIITIGEGETIDSPIDFEYYIEYILSESDYQNHFGKLKKESEPTGLKGILNEKDED